MPASDYFDWHSLAVGDIVLLECGFHYRKMILGPEPVRVRQFFFLRAESW